jgi:hypothetical protein
MRTFIISPTSDLSLLHRGGERRFYAKIEIDATIRDPASREALAHVVSDLNRHLNACGCGLASVFVVVTMAALAAFHGSSWRDWPSIGWQTGGTVFVTLCAAAALGKLIGIAYSEWMFRRLLTRLAAMLRLTKQLLVV